MKFGVWLEHTRFVEETLAIADIEEKVLVSYDT